MTMVSVFIYQHDSNVIQNITVMHVVCIIATMNV